MNRTLGLIVVGAILLPACGGKPKGPTPLRHHFDETNVALVPMDEKEGMLRAQNDYHKAKALHQKAQADLREARTDLNVAKNEQKQALLAEGSAQSRKKAAEDSNDMNRVNAAMREQRSAEVGRRAADRKIDFQEAKIRYLQKHELFALEDLYASEARYELAKARLAKSKNISPKGFDFEAFKNQADERSQRSQRAKLIADQERQKADETRKQWVAAEQEARQARGVSAN
jgi:colicin import membrane protein